MKLELPIRSNNVVIRQLTEDDFKYLYEMDSDPEVLKYADIPTTLPFEKACIGFKKYLERTEPTGYQWLAIHDMESDLFYGWCGLQPHNKIHELEIGYRIRKQYWGKGIATESAKTITAAGFTQLDINKIVACIHPGNGASKSVIVKCGYKCTDSIYNDLFKMDWDLYEITKECFYKTQK